jgi:hypothetical protein
MNDIELLKHFLDELLSEEKLIFFYHFVFQVPIPETACRLNYSSRFVKKTCNMINKQIALMPVKSMLLECFNTENIISSLNNRGD